MFIPIFVKLTINKGYPKPENRFRSKIFLLQLNLLVVRTTMCVRVFVIVPSRVFLLERRKSRNEISPAFPRDKVPRPRSRIKSRESGFHSD